MIERTERRVLGWSATLSAALILMLGAGSMPARAQDAEETAARKQSIFYRAAASGDARTFVSAAYVAGLTETLRDGGPFTLFVPTDAAFAKLPAKTLGDLLRIENRSKLSEILRYHVVPGRILAANITAEPRPATALGPRLTIAANAKGVAVDDAVIVRTDLIGRNGVVHFIDRVLTPPESDILGTARKAGSFKILLAAVEAAGLTDALRDAKAITVLAPTDEAFAKLGHEELQKLIADKKRLSRILRYHLLPEKRSARELLTAGGEKTLLGPKLDVRLQRGRLEVAQGKVAFLDTDITAENGVIHVIDSVLIPPADHH